MNKLAVDQLVTWVPFLLLCGVWIFFIRQMRKGGTANAYLKEMNSNFSKQNEELIGLTREIRDILKERK